jgi:hypothetical protein
MTIAAEQVWKNDKGVMVRVNEVTDFGWVLYRKCDLQGWFLPKTHQAETRDTSFRRRFPYLVRNHIATLEEAK